MCKIQQQKQKTAGCATQGMHKTPASTPRNKRKQEVEDRKRKNIILSIMIQYHPVSACHSDTKYGDTTKQYSLNQVFFFYFAFFF